MSEGSCDLSGSHDVKEEENIGDLLALRLLLATLHNNESSMEARRVELR